MLNRRSFLKASIAAAAAFRNAYAMPGDKFRWACTSGMFRNMDGQPDSTLQTISEYGFQGVEASLDLEKTCGSTKELKRRMDKYDIACANYWGWGDYYNPLKPEAVRATVADNIALAKDHVAVCGGRVLKVNLSWRDMAAHPVPNWWTTEEMGVLAKTLNEIGKGCHDAGVRFSFHPHNWTLIDTDYAEVRRIMDLTDPRYVFMVADTAHLSLGGTDPIRFVNDWFPRIGDVHLKDVMVKYSPAKSGWKGPAPSRAEHERDNLYKQLGTGGVDFAGFIAALRHHGYDGWVSLDYDPVRPGDRTIPENMAFRRNYVIEKLRASLRPAKGGNS